MLVKGQGEDERGVVGAVGEVERNVVNVAACIIERMMALEYQDSCMNIFNTSLYNDGRQYLGTDGNHI